MLWLILTLFDVDALLFCERRLSGILRYAYLKHACVLYMKPGTISMLKLAILIVCSIKHTHYYPYFHIS